MSFGDNDGDDIDYITPANMSHGDDGVIGPHQTKESSCEMSDMSHGDDNDSFLHQFKEGAFCLLVSDVWHKNEGN